MKQSFVRKILAFVLVLALLLPSLTELMPAVFAGSTQSVAYGEANIYDIYDLTGANTNTITGTGDGNWNGVVLGNISQEHKENIVFKTMLTMGAQEVRLSLNAKEGASIYDPDGYAVYINHNNGAPYIAIKRNQRDLVVGSPEAVQGTYELEIGIVDILTDGVRSGKHLYVKMDGVTVCEVDDTVGYLTGDALGTRFVDFHYGAAIQMDTTVTDEKTYGEATVYDIYELTGAVSNTINGTGKDNWTATALGNIDAAHKENVSFKANVSISSDAKYRFSLGALANDDCVDPAGYGFELVTGAEGYVAFVRGSGHAWLASWIGDTTSLKGEYVLEFGYRDIIAGGKVIGKQIFLMKDGEVLYSFDDVSGYLTGDALGTKVAIFHYSTTVQMNTTYETSYGTANVYDIHDLTGAASNTINGTGKDNWTATVLGNIDTAHKENVSFKAKVKITDDAKYRFSLSALAGDDCVDPAGYGFELVTGAEGYVAFVRGSSHTWIMSRNEDVTNLKGEYVLEFGYCDILFNGNVIGKRIFLMKDGEVLYSFDDVNEFLSGNALGTKVAIFHYGSAIQMNTTKDIAPEIPPQPEFGELAAGNATVYDLYDLHGAETLTLNGHATDPDHWGKVLGYILPAHKENVAFKTTVTIDEAQTVMLGLGLGDMSQASNNNSGYVLEIVMKTGKDEVDTVKIHKAGTQIYCKDQSLDFNGEYELEFGVVELYDTDANYAVVGKRIYVKVDGKEVLHCDDTENALSGSGLGTKIDVYLSGKSMKMASRKGYQASKANVYDLYDLAFRKNLDVNHKDDNGEIIWGVLIGNVEENHKGNVALKTKVQMQKDQQQNLIIGLGLKGHWPVGSGHGYKVELNGNPDNKTDSLFIYKNTEGNDPVCIYNMEQAFDFNSSFQLEVGVVDLTDGNKKVVARRIYVMINGEELMHYDDTRDIIAGSAMGTVVAAYCSRGTVTLGTCVEGIPGANVRVYDIFDLSGRATLKLNRTDAGGQVIWSNEIGRITDTNNLNYALRVNLDTSKVDGSQLQELIIGLCKDTELFDKSGYRLSLYFFPNGTTSLVLRDCVTDEILASVDGTFPQKVELEVGIMDFYDSSKNLSGKKVYMKIDGKEELSYLDKDTNRARGNLLCAYTSSPVTLATKYDYITIPVTYMVNGEKVENSKYITANTDVIAGKKSVFDVALGNKDEFTSVSMQQVLLNGQPIKPVSDKKGVYVFELENPSDSDELTVQIQVHNLTVDEANVYDLYELTGKKKIVIPAGSVNQIGTFFADGQERVQNRAIRFAYYIPKTGGGLRLGYGSDTSDIWSRVGTHIEIWCGFATISNGFHVSALSSNNTDIFKADSWSVVEVGVVKCYEDGVYKYDRWYVKAGQTADELELITYYDSTQRADGTLNIMARTPDIGDDFVLASTLEVRQVTDVSEEAAKEAAAVAFKPLFLKGETVKIAVFPKEGNKLESLYVNGEKVEATLTSDGGYIYLLGNAEADVEFSYTLSEDDRVYNITALDADNMKFILDNTTVTAGGSATVQIKVDGGYALKSLTVNGVDFLQMASYDKTTLTYTLTIRNIREDKQIQAQAEKLASDSLVADGAAEQESKINVALIVAIAVLSVAVLGGVAIVAVKSAKKKGQKQ